MKFPHTRKEQEVWQACDDLLAMGKTVKEVTGEAIGIRLRELKYKAGSSTQRYQYRDTWMVARGLSREAKEVIDTTQSSDPLMRSVAIFREGLERELRHEYDKKIQDLDELLAKQAEQTTHWQAQYENLDQQYKILSEEKNNLAVQYIHLQTDFTALQDEKIKLAVQVNLLETRLQDNNENYKTTLSTLVDSHERQIDVLQDNLIKQIQAEKEIANDIKKSGEDQRHSLLLELDKLRIQEAKRHSDVENMHSQVQYYQNLLGSLKEQFHYLNQRHEVHQQELQKIMHLQIDFPEILQTSIKECVHQSDLQSSQATLLKEFNTGINYLLQALSIQIAMLQSEKSHKEEDVSANATCPV